MRASLWTVVALFLVRRMQFTSTRSLYLKPINVGCGHALSAGA